VNVGPAFVADGEAAEVAEPRKRPFDHTPVADEAFAALWSKLTK